ncbi:MAG: IS1 family transposase, partial [Euryarchaeota archaeon]|nr:IS1 family transposase [Euryarchaeota archaeon]
WIYTAMKSDTKLHLAHRTGKRVQETANKLMAMVKSRSKVPDTDNNAMFVSDGNDQYTTAILGNFDPDTINYGQLVKERKSGRVVGKTRKIIFGDLDAGDIETVYVERYNLTLRHGISRLVRKSLCFSKCKNMLDDHLDLYQCYTNFIRPHLTLAIKTPKEVRNIERTPCMAEGITNHTWTWREFLMFKCGS